MDANLSSLLGVLAAMAFFSHDALAACPGKFLGLSCNGTSGSDVCTRNSANDVDCDLGKGISINQGADAFFVSPTSTTFRAYGTEGDGEDFCCELGSLNDGCSGNPISVVILGVDYDDTIRLLDTTANLWMDCSVTEVYGDMGADTISGSPSLDNQDQLYGQGGSDFVRGLDGDDTIEGGIGYDLLYGDEDNDTIYGGGGKDKIKGGTGDDVLYGDDDDDDICGGDDDDTLYGGNGDDVITGENDVDYNFGNAGTNTCENQYPLYCTYYTSVDSACTW